MSDLGATRLRVPSQFILKSWKTVELVGAFEQGTNCDSVGARFLGAQLRATAQTSLRLSVDAAAPAGPNSEQEPDCFLLRVKITRQSFFLGGGLFPPDILFFFGPISLSLNVGNALRRGLCGASRPNCTEGPPLLPWIVGARSGNLPKQPHHYDILGLLGLGRTMNYKMAS